MVPWGVTSHTVTALPCSHFSPCTATGILGAPAGARAPGRGEQGAGWGQGGGGSVSSLLRSCSPLQFCFYCNKLTKYIYLWDRLLPFGCRICLWIARSDHLQVQSFYLTLICFETPKAWHSYGWTESWGRQRLGPSSSPASTGGRTALLPTGVTSSTKKISLLHFPNPGRI